MKEDVSLKEVLFNKNKYSKTKTVLVIFFILLIWYFQVLEVNEWIGNISVLIPVIAGIIYFICKHSFYNTQRNIKDIVFLLVFIGLLFWGVYTHSTTESSITFIQTGKIM
ncbi:hypothetical protein [Alteribacillus sp. YIM 98480]|uniref:hypothetical protein n=1 Tax=Alteribacillus sp. YIM 98480 TaxID=2606599 RepID=UPI00131BC521|nr:hypothetical protein [Alteribacillus sp. YIM 98480]